jgi:hypothetical protein
VTRVVRTAFVALAVLCGLVLPAHARPKTDVVVLKNGDRITCEIKNLNRGKLTVKTDDMGTLYIEWNNIASVTSTGLFEIEDLAGHLYFGPLETIPDEGLQVATADGIETVPLATIARMLNYEASFWSRLSGSLDVGFAYTKSSELSEFSADGSVKRGPGRRRSGQQPRGRPRLRLGPVCLRLPQDRLRAG